MIALSMPQPHEYPVTLLDHRGKQYEVHEPGQYVTSVFKLGHKRKPKPEPAKPAPIVEAPKPVAATPATSATSASPAKS